MKKSEGSTHVIVSYEEYKKLLDFYEKMYNDNHVIFWEGFSSYGTIMYEIIRADESLKRVIDVNNEMRDQIYSLVSKKEELDTIKKMSLLEIILMKLKRKPK